LYEERLIKHSFGVVLLSKPSQAVATCILAAHSCT